MGTHEISSETFLTFRSLVLRTVRFVILTTFFGSRQRCSPRQSDYLWKKVFVLERLREAKQELLVHEENQWTWSRVFPVSLSSWNKGSYSQVRERGDRKKGHSRETRSPEQFFTSETRVRNHRKRGHRRRWWWQRRLFLGVNSPETKQTLQHLPPSLFRSVLSLLGLVYLLSRKSSKVLNLGEEAGNHLHPFLYYVFRMSCSNVIINAWRVSPIPSLLLHELQSVALLFILRNSWAVDCLLPLDENGHYTYPRLSSEQKLIQRKESKKEWERNTTTDQERSDTTSRTGLFSLP